VLESEAMYFISLTLKGIGMNLSEVLQKYMGGRETL
jgi:hypothetical protein